MKQKKDSLPEESMLNRYRIQKTIGGGGFSFVYLAEDSENGQQVVIKEYFPTKLAVRTPEGCIEEISAEKKKLFNLGRKLFFQEVSMLAGLNHPNIIEIIGFFQENGTVYSVMPYEKGLSLQQYIRKHNGPIKEQRIISIFVPILEGLKAVHEQELLHLDIKPGNIYLRVDGTPVLIDFGAVYKILRTEEPRLFPVVSHGFSPPEQSSKRTPLGTWSDIYAIGATIWTCMAGKPPPAARDRVTKTKTLRPSVEEFAGQYSPYLLEIVDECLSLSPSTRIRSADELLEMLQQKGMAA